MTARLDATDRQDFHNAATNVVAALAGRCGFTHLASGRTCLLRYRHPGPCQLVATGNDPQVNRDHCDEDQCVSAERSCAGRPATARPEPLDAGIGLSGELADTSSAGDVMRLPGSPVACDLTALGSATSTLAKASHTGPQ